MWLRRRELAVTLLLAAVVGVGCVQDETGGTAPPPARFDAQVFQQLSEVEWLGQYELVTGWPRPLPDHTPGEHDGWTWGSQPAIFAESPDRIWVAQRGERRLPDGAAPWTPGGALNPPIPGTEMHRVHHVIFALDRDGNVVEEWLHQDHLFDHPDGRGPHKITISPYDPEKHVWVIDDQLHQIFKFTYEGELVMTLGERAVPGRGPGHFGRPTDIAFLPDGTFFISDGYDGTRVAKFAPDGSFVMDWGRPPADPANPGPGEFNTVHSISISPDRRLFVADRGHDRVQVFDENGTFLYLFPVQRPLDHLVTTDGHLWAVDGDTYRVVKYDLEGNYRYGWGGGRGYAPGKFYGAHGIATDQERNFYVAEVFNGRLQKFRPRPGADPAMIVGLEATVGVVDRPLGDEGPRR